MCLPLTRVWKAVESSNLAEIFSVVQETGDTILGLKVKVVVIFVYRVRITRRVDIINFINVSLLCLLLVKT